MSGLSVFITAEANRKNRWASARGDGIGRRPKWVSTGDVSTNVGARLDGASDRHIPVLCFSRRTKTIKSSLHGTINSNPMPSPVCQVLWVAFILVRKVDRSKWAPAEDSRRTPECGGHAPESSDVITNGRCGDRNATSSGDHSRSRNHDDNNHDGFLAGA